MPSKRHVPTEMIASTLEQYGAHARVGFPSSLDDTVLEDEFSYRLAIKRMRDQDAEIARLRAALEFYADEVNWCPQGMAWSTYTGTESLASKVQDDLGQRARRALDGNESGVRDGE